MDERIMYEKLVEAVIEQFDFEKVLILCKAVGGYPSNTSVSAMKQIVRDMFSEVCAEELEGRLTDEEKMDVFEKELGRLINKHSVENVIDMPDYLLAEMIRRMIGAIGPSIKRYIRDYVGVNEIETPNKEDELLICRKLLLELVETCPIHFKYDDPDYDYSESKSRYLTALINGQRYLADSD